MIRTKIICTMGPAVNSVEKMEELIHAGMNVARINFSHGTHAEHLITIQNIKEARRLTGKPIAIMLDTKGPEIRLGLIKDNQATFQAGSRVRLMKEPIEGDSKTVSINPPEVLELLEEGMKVLFDDGLISSQVVAVDQEGVTVEIDNTGVVKSRKGVNIPYVNLNLPAVTETDVADIRFGCQNDIDIIAASFVRSAEHVLVIKKLLAEMKKSEVLVMAKIENHEGVDNFDSIVQVADGIMIARGDLGVEVPLSHVPKLQKMMIRKSYLAGKPSITATQMLESMINNPRPTRAEASDVANAIYDGTSAVMLSGETAIGKYPLDVVRVMRSIVQEAESDFDYRTFFAQHSNLIYHDVPSAVTLATVKTAYSSNAQAIFAFTTGGSTARLLSRLRPPMPILALTPSSKSYHQMSAYWGVIPLVAISDTVLDAFATASSFALDAGIVHYGDLVVVTAGSPFGVSGTTNMMLVESIGDVLTRGHQSHGERVYGNIALVPSAASRKPYSVRGQIIVITQCDDSYLGLIQEASGIILQNHINDRASELYALEVGKAMEKSVLVRADEAFRVLKEGQLVTLDPEHACVFKGVANI